MNYITDLQKNEINKKYFPNGFFYIVKTFNPTSYLNSKRFKEPFENIIDYEKAVKSVRHSNALRFYWHIKTMNKADFINEINSQYLNYTLENIENAELWLSLTYDLVLKGFSVAGKIEDLNIRSVFIDWYNLKIIEFKDKPEIPTIDLSDTTATEKIIYLHKLGVIDFLTNKNNISINGLATVLSALTGEKPETVQSMLNPIISINAGQKNNPLNSKKAVERVKQQLIKIGFNLNETI